MLLTLDWKNLLYLISQTIGFLVAILLLTYGSKKNKGNAILGLSYLFLTFAILLASLISSGLMVYFPNLYRTGNFFAFLYVPSIYIYLKIIVKDKKLIFKDLIHLFPAFLYLVDFMPVFLLPPDQKLALILGEINQSGEYIAFNQSTFFFPNFWICFRTLLVVFYWVLSIECLLRHKSKIKDCNQFFSKDWLSWIKIYLSFQAALMLPVLAFLFSVDPSYYYDIIHIPVVFLIIASGASILFFPKVLYGINEFERLIDKKIKNESLESDELPILSEEKIIEIEKTLINLESQKKFFQEKGYAIRDLAKDTGIPSYILTIYINRILETNFSDFINEKRINQCTQLILQDGLPHLTLEGLADTCGFSNRNSFLASFKKFKGMTPSAFKKGLQNKVDVVLLDKDN